jgi:hypothetical protein
MRMAAMWRSNAVMYVTVHIMKFLFSILYFLTSQSEVDFGIAHVATVNAVHIHFCTVYIHFYTIYIYFYTMYLFISNAVKNQGIHIHSCWCGSLQ